LIMNLVGDECILNAIERILGLMENSV